MANKDNVASEKFKCINCHAVVEPLNFGIRNHCNKCLFSLHLDIFPNDNANACHGLMKPVEILYNEENEMLLLHKCISCGKTSRAKVALDDNYNEIYKIINLDVE